MTGITIDTNAGENIKILNNTIESNEDVGPDWYAGYSYVPVTVSSLLVVL